MKTEKSCLTCGWFVQHYFKWKVGYLKCDSGHCKNYRRKHRLIDVKKDICIFECKSWKERIEAPDDTKNLVIEKIKRIQKDIEGIAGILAEKFDEV